MEKKAFGEKILITIMALLFYPGPGFAQDTVAMAATDTSVKMAVPDSSKKPPKNNSGKILTGIASFYSDSFNGKQTANGEIFSQKKMTCACNVLPLGTWIRVTNLKNGKSVVVKTNDRLHPRMKRIVDLTRAAAQQLDFIVSGLTKVKVEVLGKKKP
jgi:rare lipoprotein A